MAGFKLLSGRYPGRGMPKGLSRIIHFLVAHYCLLAKIINSGDGLRRNRILNMSNFFKCQETGLWKSFNKYIGLISGVV